MIEIMDQSGGKVLGLRVDGLICAGAVLARLALLPVSLA